MKNTNEYAVVGTGLLVGAGVGAALMYLFDPDRGRGRRHRIEDRTKSLCHNMRELTGKLAKDVENRVEGLAAEAERLVDDTPVDGDRLIARVRAKLGHLVRRPHRVTVEADEAGRVMLSGDVEAAEAGRLMAGVMAVPGVKDVHHKLTLRHAADAGAATIASVAGGLITFAGLRALKRAG